MHSVLFTKQAATALRRMPRNAARLICEKIDQIALDPYAAHNNATRLQGRPGYRLRVGDWRVIYEVEDRELVILVLRIAARGEVYR